MLMYVRMVPLTGSHYGFVLWHPRVNRFLLYLPGVVSAQARPKRHYWCLGTHLSN